MAIFQQQGADVNKRGEHSTTIPLYLAAEGGFLDVVRFLHQQGARIDERAHDGRTPLFAAAEHGHLNVCRYLHSKGADILRVDEDGSTPLRAAAMNGQTHVVRFFVEQGADILRVDEDGSTPLRAAAMNGQTHVVRFFVEQGAAVDSECIGRTPLQSAAMTGHLGVVRFLLDAGARIDRQGAKGCTALMLATCFSRKPVIEELLSRGANFQLMSLDGHSALSFARQSEDPSILGLFLPYLEPWNHLTGLRSLCVSRITAFRAPPTALASLWQLPSHLQDEILHLRSEIINRASPEKVENEAQDHNHAGHSADPSAATVATTSPSTPAARSSVVEDLEDRPRKRARLE
eukprot:TRINITY_DN8571_c0_g1_i1.p1 TRINITY_DN8571_c0_g1~~TRINITY_DN8571_c0_g1_i1.p1  ORF type:complete len:347 (-),score=48.60 TRINITY_DN8571_c0_g1_i1:16-1056(-)